jgi:DNA-binding YbaB/EbfC family protein
MSNPMMQAMQQLQEMQAKMEQARAALAEKRITEEGGDGWVRVSVTGLGHVHSLQLSPEALATEDREMLEDVLVTTINRALDRARDTANDDLGEATRGLMPDIPGLDLPL